METTIWTASPANSTLLGDGGPHYLVVPLNNNKECKFFSSEVGILLVSVRFSVFFRNRSDYELGQLIGSLKNFLGKTQVAFGYAKHRTKTTTKYNEKQILHRYPIRNSPHMRHGTCW